MVHTSATDATSCRDTDVLSPNIGAVPTVFGNPSGDIWRTRNGRFTSRIMPRRMTRDRNISRHAGHQTKLNEFLREGDARDQIGSVNWLGLIRSATLSHPRPWRFGLTRRHPDVAPPFELGIAELRRADLDQPRCHHRAGSCGSSRYPAGATVRAKDLRRRLCAVHPSSGDD